MGLADVKIEVSATPYWMERNRRLKRLKSVTTSTTTSNSTVDLQTSVAASSSNNHLVNDEIQTSLTLFCGPQTTASMFQMQTSQVHPVTEEPANDSLDVPDALYWAAATNDLDAFLEALEQVSVEKQLDFSNIVRLVTPSRNTLLHVAAIHGCVRNVKLLLYHSPALILKQNIHGDTPLHLAARSRNKMLMFVFCGFLTYKHKADFHQEWARMVGTIPEIEKSVALPNRYGNTALHEVAFLGCYLAMSTFIKGDTEACFCINKEGKSPLYLTAEVEEGKYVGFMLQLLRQVDFKERTIGGLSPFLPAVLKTNKDLVDHILEYESAFISLLDEDGKTPLHYAASIGSLDMVRYILDKKVEYAMARDKNGFLPIHTAATYGNTNVIEHLLKYGLGPSELLTREAQNILHVAAMRGNNDVVTFVLKTSSLEGLITEGDVDGNTPLHLAVLNWHAKVVFTMTWDKRVDLARVNKEGFTPLDAAQNYMERPPSFNKRLTWTALKAAGAPESRAKEFFQSNPIDPIGTQQSNTVDTNNYKDRVNTLLVVATLVATVTFASGFTVPGGYNNSDPNQGMATLLRHTAFQIFILSDTVAMYSSILVAISLIWAQLGDVNLVYVALRIAIPLLGVSLAMMSLAFMSGVYLVVSQLHWLAYIVLITGFAFLAGSLLLFIPLCLPVTSKCRILRYISYYSFLLLILVTSESGCKVNS